MKTSFLTAVIALVPFCFNFMLFVYMGHANFDFKLRCFWLFKRFELSKSLFPSKIFDSPAPLEGAGGMGESSPPTH